MWGSPIVKMMEFKETKLGVRGRVKALWRQIENQAPDFPEIARAQKEMQRTFDKQFGGASVLMGMTLAVMDRDVQLIGSYHTVTAKNSGDGTIRDFAAIMAPPDVKPKTRKITVVD